MLTRYTDGQTDSSCKSSLSPTLYYDLEKLTDKYNENCLTPSDTSLNQTSSDTLLMPV